MPVLDFLFRRQVFLGMGLSACFFVPWNQRRRYFLLRCLPWLLLSLALLEMLDPYVTPLSPGFLLADMLMVSGLIWFCFDISLIHALFSATCAYAVQHLTSKLTYLFEARQVYAFRLQTLLPPGAGASHLQMDSGRILFVLLLVNLVAAIPIFYLFTRRIGKQGYILFDNVSVVVYAGLFLAVAVFVSIQLENGLDPSSPSFLQMYKALNGFCVLFAVTILCLEYSNLSIRHLEQENKVLEHLLESDRLQYEQSKKAMEKMNIRYHDLKQQYAPATEEERNKLEEEMKTLNLRYYTGNKAVDIALTQKSIICESLGIQFLCTADSSPLAHIRHYHLYSLLGNAIDNAIECLEKVEDPAKKVIVMEIGRCRDMAIIRIENYTPTLPVLQNGGLISTKPDVSQHGYGMKSIRNIAQIYGGTAEFFVEQNIFYLVITLRCQDAPRDENRAV